MYMLTSEKYYPTDQRFPAFPGPLYPLGWGLTYSAFKIELAAGSAATATLQQGGEVKRTVEITNVGKVDSDEVVQVYFAPQFTRAGTLPRAQCMTSVMPSYVMDRVGMRCASFVFLSLSLSFSLSRVHARKA